MQFARRLKVASFAVRSRRWTERLGIKIFWPQLSLKNQQNRNASSKDRVIDHICRKYLQCQHEVEGPP